MEPDTKLVMTGNYCKAGKLVVVEYPKSGGTWLVSMLAHCLNLPRRDIYITDDLSKNVYDASKHPWYKGANSLALNEQCVIKSHDYPESERHQIDAKFIHLIRDGRDVVISKYFFEKDFCVKNGITDKFSIEFDDYVNIVSKEWADFVSIWSTQNIIKCKYEALTLDAFSQIKIIFSGLGLHVSDEVIHAGVSAYTVEKMKDELGKAYKHNTFVRKAVPGDWRNYFGAKHKEIFKKNAGDLLVDLGYESGSNW